ncbi:MAG: hypothetical protein OXG44_13455, partial [Gammaproteobacteria bacterium]|nr:hypothetical protein [Gammaproteobacteria bacterium]
MAAVKLTDGNDLWPGTGDNSRDDAVLGDRGDDTLYGGLGHDFLAGGHDDDYLDGGPGNDTLNGDALSDYRNTPSRRSLGSGSDTLYGG